MKYGYSLTKGFGIGAERFREMEKLSAAAGALCCITANPGVTLIN